MGSINFRLKRYSMISDELVKEETKLEKFLIKQGRADLVHELRKLGAIELKGRMLQQSLFKQETLNARENDEELKQLKSAAREAGAKYNESLRMNDKISRFIGFLIKDIEG